MDDAAIVALYFRRSEQAIGETAAKYGAYCMKLSRNILQNEQESEENVNDTYLKAWNSIPPNRPTSLCAYLGKIARNLALNRYRAGRAEKRGAGALELSLDELAEILPGNSTAEERLDAEALSQSISAFLHTQNAQARRLFVRRYFYCESIDELAARYSMREGTVKSILSRTRNRLRLHLEKEGWMHEA